MQMKNLLRLMGALALTTGAATSVVACNQQTVVNLDTVLKNKALGTIYVTDITKPTEQELKDAIKAAPGNENINLDGITVTVIDPKVKSDPISSATVTPDGKIYNGDAITVNFTLATKVDIKDIKIDKLEKAVDTTKSFTDLNKDQVIITAVVDAIKKAKQIDVVANTDFTLNNNKEKDGNQVAGNVEFTVTAKGDKITGEFKFTLNLK